MLSKSSRLGVVVVMPWQKSISSKTLLPPRTCSPLQTSTRCFFPNVPYFNPFGPILRISGNFFENFLGPWAEQQQQQRRRNSEGRYTTTGLLDKSVPKRISTGLKGGASRKHGLFVDAITSTDDPKTNLNHTPLHDDLQRYGVHESDYIFNKVVPQEPDFSQEDLTEHNSAHTSTSRMPRKRKPTADLTSGSKRPPSSNKKSAVAQDWCCYLLVSVDAKKTYVGITFDIRRRLRQHNGEISGGAKAARAGRPWRLVCTVKGFKSRSEGPSPVKTFNTPSACQFEWQWKSTAAKVKAVKQQESEIVEPPLMTRRRATLAKVFESEEWNYLDIHWNADH